MYQQSISIFIGLRYFWNQHLPKFKKFITIFSILSVSTSITALIIMISIMNGFQDEFLNTTLSFIPHVIITNENKNINQFTLPKKISSMKNIIKISNFINHKVIIEANHRVMMGEIIGVDASNYTDIYQYNIRKILYKLKTGTNNIVIGIKLAQKLHVKLGDKIRIIVSSLRKHTINKQSIKNHLFQITGIFESHNEVDYYQILMHQTDASNLLDYSKNHITGWRLWFKDPLSINYNEVKKFAYPLITLDWKMYKSDLFKIIQIEKYIMILLFSLVLFVVSGNVIMNLMLSITDKTHSIAILKSQGLSDLKIMLIFIILGSTTTMIGLFLGIMTSMFLIFHNTFIIYAINILFNGNHISIFIKISQIFLISGISLLCAILLTLYPAWTTIRLKPVKILSNNE